MTKYGIDTKELNFLINSTYEIEFLILYQQVKLNNSTLVMLRKFRCFLYWYHYASVDFLSDLLPTNMDFTKYQSWKWKKSDNEIFYPIQIDSYLFDNVVDRKNFIAITYQLRRSWVRRVQR